MNRNEVIELQHKRFAVKKYDPNRRISDEDWNTLVEVGRLAPSSLGFEPWKMLLLENKQMREDLKEILLFSLLEKALLMIVRMLQS